LLNLQYAITLWFGLSGNKLNQVIIYEIAKLDKMTVSKSLKKLISLNLIKRYEDQKDTRAKILELTKQEKKWVTKLIPLIESVDNKFFGKLANEKSKSFTKLLMDLYLGNS